LLFYVEFRSQSILTQRRSRPFVDDRNRPDVSETRADDVLISRTVKDLVAASGTRFEDFGAHVLFEWLSLLSLFAALPRKMQARWIAFSDRETPPSLPGRAVGKGRIDRSPQLEGTAASGAACAFSRRPLSLAFRPFVAPILKGSKGSDLTHSPRLAV
jgi:hypothetical protein